MPNPPLSSFSGNTAFIRLFLFLLLGPLFPSLLHAQVPGAIQPYNNSNELYSRANRIYEYGRETKNHHESNRAYRTAIPLFKEFIIAAPTHEFTQKARYRLGMSYLLTGQIETAEKTFQTVIKRYRTGHYVATSAYRIAAQYYNASNWPKAIPYFKIAAEQADKPNLRHKSLYYQARCHILSNQSTGAISSLKAMIEDPANPFSDYARLAIGQIYASQERHEDALEQFEQLISKRTAPQERAQALLAAGVSAVALGDSVRAEDYLNQTINTPGLDQKFKSKAQLSLMKMRFTEKEYASVIKQFSRGEFKGDDATLSEVYMLAGRSFAQLNRHHEAIRYFFNAQRLSPTTTLSFEASYRRLLSFYQIDDTNVPSQVDAFVELYGGLKTDKTWVEETKLMKAESLLHRSSGNRAATVYANINPSKLPDHLVPDLYFKRGWALASTNDHNNAVQSLSKFITNFPENPRILQALARRGYSYLLLGDRGSALKDFEQVLAANPDPKLAAFCQQQTGRIFRESKRYDDLIERYSSLLADHSDLTQQAVASANYWIGWGWYKLEDYEKCAPYFDKARTLMPAIYNEPAGTHLTLAAYSQKDPVLLKKQIDRLLEDVRGKILPSNMLTWLGLQMFNQYGDYESADRYLTMASTPDDPDYTDLIVWRHLAKARIEMRHFSRAMNAIPIMLEMETRDFWKADAHLDKSHALIGIEKWDEAWEAAHDGLELNPAGTIKAGLHMSLGEIAMHRKDYESAAASFLKTADLFVDDTQIKPRALQRAAEALEASGDIEQAQSIRKKLENQFQNKSSARK